MLGQSKELKMQHDSTQSRHTAGIIVAFTSHKRSKNMRPAQMFRFATPSLTKKKERSMFPTKALRFVRALYILAAVLPAYGLQLYGQGLDSRPNPIAARAAAARAAAAAKLAAAKGATVG